MTDEESRKLQPGIYAIYWINGGCSVAAVGQSIRVKALGTDTWAEGPNWFAPTNWLHRIGGIDESGVPCTDWKKIKSVTLLTTQGVLMNNDPNLLEEEVELRKRLEESAQIDLDKALQELTEGIPKGSCIL